MTEPWAEVTSIYPTRQEIAFAKEWASNPPERLEHLVASVPVQILLRFARAAEDFLELRVALARRRVLRADGGHPDELHETEAWLKKRSAELADPYPEEKTGKKTDGAAESAAKESH